MDFVIHLSFYCSVAHAALPPYDKLKDYPRCLKVYKVFLNTLSWFAINVRGAVIGLYTSYQMDVKQIQKPSEGK